MAVSKVGRRTSAARLRLNLRHNKLTSPRSEYIERHNRARLRARHYRARGKMVYKPCGRTAALVQVEVLQRAKLSKILHFVRYHPRPLREALTLLRYQARQSPESVQF